MHMKALTEFSKLSAPGGLAVKVDISIFHKHLAAPFRNALKEAVRKCERLYIAVSCAIAFTEEGMTRDHSAWSVLAGEFDLAHLQIRTLQHANFVQKVNNACSTSFSTRPEMSCAVNQNTGSKVRLEATYAPSLAVDYKRNIIVSAGQRAVPNDVDPRNVIATGGPHHGEFSERATYVRNWPGIRNLLIRNHPEFGIVDAEVTALCVNDSVETRLTERFYFWRSIATMTCLRTLEVKGFGDDSDGYTHLKAAHMWNSIGCLTQLYKLRISGTPYGIDTQAQADSCAMAAALRQLRCLTSLDLREVRFQMQSPEFSCTTKSHTSPILRSP